MSIVLRGDVICVQGKAPVEDAEPLLAHLRAVPGRTVDLSACEHLHAAVVQVLLATRPQLAGEIGDTFARTWLGPLLAPSIDGASAVS